MIEKILERLEAEIASAKKTMKTIVDNGGHTCDYAFANGRKVACMEMKEIVQEVVKEFANDTNVGDKWIPCSERLPNTDENRKYLVCGEKGGIYIAEFVCKAVNNTSIGPWWSASGRYAPEPIAWQPLPAPYQKGE